MQFPSHGRLDCSACFRSGESTSSPHPKWNIRNDPGAWGSATPKILILGFSKGATQTNIYASGDFDKVAFGGKETRTNLTNILRRVRLLDGARTSDNLISATEQEFAFGSLVRCSAARLDEKVLSEKGTRVYRTSGELILKSFKEIPEVIDRCTERFLSDLPSSLGLLVFLGVTDGYIAQCRALIQKLYPDGFAVIDDVSYKTNRFCVVHLTHPSKGNGTIDAWLNVNANDPMESSRKRASAQKREKAIRRISLLGFAVES